MDLRTKRMVPKERTRARVAGARTSQVSGCKPQPPHKADCTIRGGQHRKGEITHRAHGSRRRQRLIVVNLEEAEQYDEMADYMDKVGASDEKLSVEERNLLSVGYKNAVGSRRTAWRIVTSAHEKEKSKGNTDQAGLAQDNGKMAETELQKKDFISKSS